MTSKALFCVRVMLLFKLEGVIGDLTALVPLGSAMKLYSVLEAINLCSKQKI